MYRQDQSLVGTRRQIVVALMCMCGVVGRIQIAGAQSALMPAHMEPFRVDSGLLDNSTDQPAVVFEVLADFGGLYPWSRVVFSEVALPAASMIRITALGDGQSQMLDSQGLRNWGNMSAFFDGDTLRIQLVAGPHTSGNFLKIDDILVGEESLPMAQARAICGPDDQRLASDDKGVGRLLVTFVDPPLVCGCTGFIINTPPGSDKHHLSAGHCFFKRCTDPPTPGDWASAVMQFDVQNSEQDCDIKPPEDLAKDQFPVINPLVSWKLTGAIGEDWAVYRCGLNGNGKTTFTEQDGTAFVLAEKVPETGSIKIVGYGADGNENAVGGGNAACTCEPTSETGSRNHIQQTAQGSILGNVGKLDHDVDTCRGNSGSPIYLVSTTDVVGIQTHGGCTDTGGQNHGTLITRISIPPIPILSEWGLITMALLVLTAGTLVCARRRPAHA